MLHKRMSKTMAVEIADRTLQVVNPQNRSLALQSTLRRHGFDAMPQGLPDPQLTKPELVAWLLAAYPG